MNDTCYFCGDRISPGAPAQRHHPDKANHPDWTEPAHAQCHRAFHSTNGHFRQWGQQGGIAAPFRGRPGYELAVAKWPAWHRMGGLSRAHSAQRDERGRFRPGPPRRQFADQTSTSSS